MKKTIKKTSGYRTEQPKTAMLPNRIRRMLITLTIPSILSGCAHQSGNNSHPPSISASPGKKVFHVGPAKPYRQSDETYAAISPGLTSTFSTNIIVENILSRKFKSRKFKPAGTAKSGGPLKNNAPKTSLPILSGQMTKAAGMKVVARKLPSKNSGKKGGDSWERVRQRLVLAGVEHEAVDSQIQGLLRDPSSLGFLIKRAEPFLQYLLDEIERHDLPSDLVLVPMVESAFDTTAVSPKQAAGIWQIIPSTGEQYGLRLTEGYDGRYDIHAATQAAFAYLKHLKALFNGDWLMALAAYNVGEGAVRRAVEANQKAGKGTSFWDLDLPAETKAYVPKIVALSRIFADPETHGFAPGKLGTAPRLARVEVGPDIRLADIIAAAGLSQEEFYRLNPAFKLDVQPPIQTYNLFLPLDKAATLASNSTGTKLWAARRIVVKKGETLMTLAKRHGVPPLKLAEWNGLSPNSALKAGQELIVYPV